MKGILVLFSLFIILLASGCVSIDPEAIAKASPIVQSFLTEFPNAQIRVVSYSGDQVQSVLEQYIADCNKTAIPSDVYKIDIIDPDSGLSAAAWIDKSTMSIDCAIKRSKPLPNSTYCDSHAESKCYDNHVYWFDSCGNKEDEKEHCELGYGCEAGACILYQQRRCNGFQYITYIDQAAGTGSFTLHGRNGVNGINITAISVGGTSVNTDTSNVTMTVGGSSFDPSSGNYISQGQEFTVDYADGLTLTAGAYDDLAVTITYNVKNGLIGLTDTATCVGSVALVTQNGVY